MILRWKLWNIGCEGEGGTASLVLHLRFPVAQLIFTSAKLLLVAFVLGAGVGMTILHMCPKARFGTENATTQVALVVLPASISESFSDFLAEVGGRWDIFSTTHCIMVRGKH